VCMCVCVREGAGKGDVVCEDYCTRVKSRKIKESMNDNRIQDSSALTSLSMGDIPVMYLPPVPSGRK
jgi:hypothetical protein